MNSLSTEEPEDEEPQVVQHAADAYEAVRSINHLTFGAVPAPVVYDVLGNLKNVGHLLPQALGQLGAGLERSLSEYDVVEDDGGDPAESIALARAYLEEAAALAGQVGELLEKAQGAINRQGYNAKENQ
jgi:hypothetical protein